MKTLLSVNNNKIIFPHHISISGLRKIPIKKIGFKVPLKDNATFQHKFKTKISGKVYNQKGETAQL